MDFLKTAFGLRAKVEEKQTQRGSGWLTFSPPPDSYYYGAMSPDDVCDPRDATDYGRVDVSALTEKLAAAEEEGFEIDAHLATLHAYGRVTRTLGGRSNEELGNELLFECSFALWETLQEVRATKVANAHRTCVLRRTIAEVRHLLNTRFTLSPIQPQFLFLWEFHITGSIKIPYYWK